MSDTQVLIRLRRFLLWAVAGACLALPVELALAEHVESPLQQLPFALCALGLAGALWMLRRPSRPARLGLRGAMLLQALGGVWGIWAHLQANLELELEIRPTEGLAQVWPAALMGASPLLAPGALILVAALGLAATHALDLPQARR
ncbi:MAG: hypothetical protein H6648_02205 [Caldilineae bacterium]|nr:hypothetical protein [Chloroflexota bacterium]MCB9175944.1 hypothetical protein [Caldilineae bacterium]